jgi:hypothetical protein
MKYYKVVRGECNKLYSFLPKEILPDGIIEYELNEFVTPKIPGSKLFVFGSLEAAYMFFIGSEYRIYEVECENPVPIDSIVDLSYINIESIKHFWRGCTEFTKNSPDNSYACDSVKLIREITRSELKECISRELERRHTI